MDLPFKSSIIFGLAFACCLQTAILAQDPPPPPPPPPDQTLSPDQLSGLVAPIALYPDPLISQILVAATYPLELVQASQWLQRNSGLQGQDLAQAAQQQNWDASVQALVAFPSVLRRLSEDINWTTDLGNAFLAQQGDVMDAIQRMRRQAEQAGKLRSTDQMRVVDTEDAGAPVVELVPANPAVIYVPEYDPAWIWGPPLWYPYPRWYWPARPMFGPGVYFGFGGGIAVGAFFGGGWGGGWGGYGWHPGWGSHTVIVNNTFIHRNNFNTVNITNVHNTSVWSHDATHRQGVPYANQQMSQRYQAPVRQNLQSRGYSESTTGRQFGGGGGGERFGNRQISPSSPSQNRSAFGHMESGQQATTHTDHGYSSLGSRSSGGSYSGSRYSGRGSSPAPRGNPGGGGGGRRR